MHTHVSGFRYKYSFRLAVMRSAGTNQATRDKTSRDQPPLQPLQGCRAFSQSHPFSSRPPPAATPLPFLGLAVHVARGWTGSRSWAGRKRKKRKNSKFSHVSLIFFPFLENKIAVYQQQFWQHNERGSTGARGNTGDGSKVLVTPTSPFPSQEPSPAWLGPWWQQVLDLQVLGSQRSRNYYDF